MVVNINDPQAHSSIDDAMREFKKQKNVDNAGYWDKFFAKYGVGNYGFTSHMPFERYMWYKDLMSRMKKIDRYKFNKIHKGTLYYFLSWTSFDFRDYETSLFYMDCAVSEDMRQHGIRWINTPSREFLVLKDGGFQAAKRMTNKYRYYMENNFDCYTQKVCKYAASFDKWICRFVDYFTSQKDPKARTLISSFYSFCLEFNSKRKLLDSKPLLEGSIETFTMHLLKGGLIFESLLKVFYPQFKDKTLGYILKKEMLKKDFPLYTFRSFNKASFEDVINYAKSSSNDYVTKVFNVTYGIRNKTGHNLISYSKGFSTSEYAITFGCIMDAVFHLTYVKCK